MGDRRWTRLSPAQRDLLLRSTRVWESALEAELIAANEAGYAMGREQGITFLDMPAAEQSRFEEIYARDGEARAQSLQRFGIDGLTTFRRARALAPHVAAGENIACKSDSHEPTP